MVSALPEDFVKICGVTRVDDAVAVVNAGASALGLIFAESPRRVTLAQARQIVSATEGSILRCAVFRNSDDVFVTEQLDALDVEMVQVHGTLSSGLLAYLRGRGLRVVKALSVIGSEFECFDDIDVDAVLIDGALPGSGTEHSWDRLRERRFSVPVVAAGGLTPDNVYGVVRATGASGVDCASGVEASPGVKDHELLGRFVANARRALASEE